MEDRSFLTNNHPTDGVSDTFHEYVDLGLPSGTLWATCNIGATKPEEYGEYFAWGETKPKSIYDWTTYKFANGDSDKLTKYGFTDNLTVLQSCDDAATANWGSDWCMPSVDQWRELRDNTNIALTTRNGVNGILFTANNGHSLFLPAGGWRQDDVFGNVGIEGLYWLSSITPGTPWGAWYLDFGLDGFGMSGTRNDRYYGRSVRAVRSTRQN